MKGIYFPRRHVYIPAFRMASSTGDEKCRIKGRGMYKEKKVMRSMERMRMLGGM